MSLSPDARSRIDVRSDTVSMPTPEMLETILSAPLGDDIMREDPSVTALEAEAAEVLGMEAGLLCASGTMANQVAVMTLTGRGDEVVVGAESHVYTMETGALAALCQVQVRPVSGPDGVPLAPDFEQAIMPPDVGRVQQPDTGLICLENTYNLNAGRVVTPAQTMDVVDLARGHGVPVYLDGARVFNAAAALGVPPSDLCRGVDAVQFNLTKGLGAPVGSILAGSAEVIDRARKNRQRIGGGMRQAGIIAAPGRYALRHHLARLGDDNRRARALADLVHPLPGLQVSPDAVESNIVFVRVAGGQPARDAMLGAMAERGVLAKPIGRDAFRMVLHLGVDDAALERLAAVVRECAEDGPGGAVASDEL